MGPADEGFRLEEGEGHGDAGEGHLEEDSGRTACECREENGKVNKQLRKECSVAQCSVAYIAERLLMNLL